MDVARVQIQTSSWETINRWLKVRINGDYFNIRLIEEPFEDCIVSSHHSQFADNGTHNMGGSEGSSSISVSSEDEESSMEEENGFEFENDWVNFINDEFSLLMKTCFLRIC